MINRRFAALLVLFAPLAACVSGDDSVTPSPNPNAGFQARFVPLGGIMPFPNDLYFSGSTTGQLNIPGSTAVSQNGPLLELNHLDGYGTQSDISIYFTAPVDKTTLKANVLVYKVDSSYTTKAVTVNGSATKLKVGIDYSIGLSPGIDAGGSIVTIKPLKPLAASTVDPSTHLPIPATYLVLVTNGVKDMSGAAVSPSPDYQAILTAFLPVLQGKPAGSTGNPQLDQVAPFIFAQLGAGAVAGVDVTKVALSFSFSTSYLGISLAQLAATATATDETGTAIVDTSFDVCTALFKGGKLPNNTTACAAVPGSTVTDVFAGTVALPYYLPVPTAANPTAALAGSWKNAKGGDIRLDSSNLGSFMPKATVAKNVIPILVAIPDALSGCTMPAGGWPVVIFQHGITRNREDMLAIASTLAVGGAPTLCNAVIAIDLPLHGVTNKADLLYLAGHERTFDMDLEDNTTLAAGPDGKIDGSGAWFINLNSTITSRDNLREGAADLINLVASLPNITAGSNHFDSSQVFFVGHSLGGIEGTVFLGADTASGSPKVVAATLAMPGGHIAELLRNSAAFGPVIDAGLAAQGLVKGSQAYFDFYSEAQAVVEDGDPANYAALAAAGHPIHMIEVVGGFNGATDTCNLPDLVVPNANTDLLASLMGLSQVNTTTAGSKFLVRYMVGDHGSILDPSVPGAPTSCVNNTTNQQLYGAATVEMQTESVKWIFASGTAITINNSPPIIQ
jgi:pimeloyl-ACP methyl ester carboxylesterase